MSNCATTDGSELTELISVSDDVISVFCDLGGQYEGELIGYINDILKDILQYTEAVRMGKLAELINTHPTIRILGDFLMGRSKGRFVAGFDSFEFVLQTGEAPAIRVVAVMLRREALS